MHIISMDDHKQYAVFIDDIKIAISKYSLYLSNILSVSKLYDLFIKKENLKDREKNCSGFAMVFHTFTIFSE